MPRQAPRLEADGHGEAEGVTGSIASRAQARRPLRVAILGAGNAAEKLYVPALASASSVQLVGVASRAVARAQALAGHFGGRAYRSTSELLADPAIEMVVNLTAPAVHGELTRQCLEAGKHVYSEKPLALSYEEARALVELAERRGLRIGCAPSTFLGEAAQTAWRLLRSGEVGPVRVVFAEANWGRLETWHADPQELYRVGALFDIGVYPVSLLTSIFGPVRSVSGFGRVVSPKRSTRGGLTFELTRPDVVVAELELEEGPLVRLTASYYVGQNSKQHGIEFHGDQGSVALSSWVAFDAAVELAPSGREYRELPLVRAPFRGVDWGRGLTEMVSAMAGDRPHRASASQAAHVVEVLCAVEQSMNEERPVPIVSSFVRPEPMEWASYGNRS